jgi:hypothetical protein
LRTSLLPATGATRCWTKRRKKLLLKFTNSRWACLRESFLS